MSADPAADVAAKHHITVQNHMNIIHCHRQIRGIRLPERRHFYISRIQILEELLQTAACRIGQNAGRTVRIQTSQLPTIAFPSARMDRHMTGFSASEAASLHERSVMKYRSPDRIAQGQIKEALRHLCMHPGCVCTRIRII